MNWIKLTDTEIPKEGRKIGFLTNNILFPDNARFGIRIGDDYYSNGETYYKYDVTHYFYVEEVSVKKSTIELDNLKCSDGWYELGLEIGLSEKEIYKTFEYGEYGHIEIEVDENLNIIGGKIIPCGK